MRKKIRVAVVDDQLLFRKGILSLLEEFDELKIVLEASNGRELLDKIKMQEVDVVLLDLEMPVLNGIETTEILKKKYPEIKIVILTLHNNDAFVVELLRKGAHGFLLKDNDIETVVNAIFSVYVNGVYFNPQISQKLIKGLVQGDTISPLFTAASFSSIELQVIDLICKEHSSKEIASVMNVSARTVDGYIEKIFEKTNARNRIGIVMYAVKHGIVK